jgi:oligopeptidase B
MAKRVPSVRSVHGRERIDYYNWLRNRSDPDVLAYLEAENDYTTAMTRHTESLRDGLFREMLGRIEEDDLSVPYRLGPYWYYMRTEEGRSYPVYCRRADREAAAEEIILDVNDVARGYDYCHVGAVRISPNHKLLAFAVDHNGGESYTLHVRDLASGEFLPDAIPNTSLSVEWAADSTTLFFTVLNALKRPFKVLRHRLDDAPDAAVEIFHEADEAFFLSVTKARSREFLFIRSSSATTSESWFLSAAHPLAAFTVVQPRRRGVEYALEHHDTRLFMRTNERAKNFKVVVTDIAEIGGGTWQTYLEHRPSVFVTGLAAFRNHLVIWERTEGLTGVRVIDLETGTDHEIPFDEPVYTVLPAENPEFDTTTLRFVYTSLITAWSIFDYDMGTRARDLKKQIAVLGGYDPTAYHSERVFATAADGTRVPISLVYRTPLERDGNRPMLLYGYGAYGASMDPEFTPHRLSLLDRGFVYAIAHVRGGGEEGRPWYDAGKLLHKTNTFTDFIAAAEHVIAEGYTSASGLAIRGGSAGGLLMGAVANMRPDLFRAVVAEVPFVDVVNTMLDPSIPLTVIEYDEWGNPQDPAYHDYILSYSPYDNVHEGPYPDMLVTAGLNDPRVQYWEPAKLVAKMRAVRRDENVLMLHTYMGAGHGGATDRYEGLRERAFWMAFVLDRLDIPADVTNG